MPEIKTVSVFTIDEVEVMVNYEIKFEIHPDYKGMSVKELKACFNFDDGESVPDVGYVNVLNVRGQKDLEGVVRSDVEEAIKLEEGTEDLFFEW